MSDRPGVASSALAPHPRSGVIEAPGTATWRAIVTAVHGAGWSTDGLHAEPPEATVAELLERRQPRPIHWGCGLLAWRCVRILASGQAVGGYASIRAPRKASGPDLAFLFIGAEGALGRVEGASFGTVRPAARYLTGATTFDEGSALFRAAREVSRREPLATRRLTWETRQLTVWLPVRGSAHEPHRRWLSELGVSTELAPGVPEAERYRSADEGPPPWLRVSGPYRSVAEVLATAESKRGRRRLAVSLDYPDSHGLVAGLSMARAGADLLEALYDDLVESGKFDELCLRLPDETVRRPLTTWIEGGGL